MPKEKRKEKRVAHFLAARIVAWGSESFGFVRDLSSEGLGLFCDRLFQEGVVIQISFNSPDWILTLTGEVIWRLDSAEKGKGKYRYGVAIQRKSRQYDFYVENLYVAAAPDSTR